MHCSIGSLALALNFSLGELNCDEFLVVRNVQIIVLAEVCIWNSELKQLSWESLRMTVFLRHANHEVISTLCKLRLCLKLSVAQWVKLDISVRGVDVGELTALDNEVEDEEEAAADLDDTFWLTSGEDYEFVLEEEGTFDMEVLDVQVHFGEPSPLLAWWCQPNIFLVNRGIELEAIGFEVDHHEKGDGLLLVVLDHDLLGHSVQIWKDSSDGSRIFLKIVVVALFVFISTAQKDVGDLTFRFLRQDTRSDQFSWNSSSLSNPWFLFLLLVTELNY